MSDNQSRNPKTTQIPEAIARKADRRAMEIFEREARQTRTFAECLGQVYMVGVKAGLEETERLRDVIADLEAEVRHLDRRPLE